MNFRIKFLILILLHYQTLKLFFCGFKINQKSRYIKLLDHFINIFCKLPDLPINAEKLNLFGNLIVLVPKHFFLFHFSIIFPAFRIIKQLIR